MAGHFGIVCMRYRDHPPPQRVRRGRQVSRSPIGAAWWGDYENGHIERISKPFHMPPLFQILTDGKNASCFDYLCRAEERRAITRTTASHNHRRGSGNHVRHFAASFFNGGSSCVYRVGESYKFLA